MLRNTCVWLRVCSVIFILSMSTGFAQQSIPLASGGGVTLYSVAPYEPLPMSWGDSVATTVSFQSAMIVAKTDDPTATISKIEGIRISGDVVQAWNPILGDNPLRPSVGVFYSPEWLPLDTHLLIPDDAVARGFYSFSESNDRSLGRVHPGFGGPLACSACHVEIGIGATRFGQPNDWFVLHPEFASHEIQLAQIVTSGSVSISVGVFGTGTGGVGIGSSFDNAPVVFVPELNEGFLLPALTMVAVHAFRKRRRWATKC